MASDIYFGNVSLLLRGDGTDGSTTIVDSSGSPKTPFDVGAVTISTTQSKFGGSALKFPGSGQQLRYSADAGFNPGTGPFTLEFWLYLNSTSAAQTIATNYKDSTHGFGISVLSGGGLAVNLSGDEYDITTSSGVVSANTWMHVALSGQEGSYKLFADGTQVGSTYTGSVSLDSDAVLSIGGLLYAGTWYDRTNGYVDEFRITKGVARYTSNFTPPTEEFGGSIRLAGQVKDASNNPAARLIRALREDTGVVIGTTTSDGTTGNYTINTTYNGPHSLIAYPDTGESLPALTYRGVMPV